MILKNCLNLIILVGLILAFLVGNASAKTQQATAEMKNAGGQVVGKATFSQQSEVVLINVQVTNLPPGKHGMHIHAVARCDPPNFTSAGPHFNPFAKHHGFLNPLPNPHAGDLPSLEVAADGTGMLEYNDPLVTLAAGPVNSLFHPNGTSVVIHANPDDQMSDPAGKSGTRIACGMILAVAAPTFVEQYGLVIAAAVGIVVVVAILVATRRRKAQAT